MVRFSSMSYLCPLVESQAHVGKRDEGSKGRCFCQLPVIVGDDFLRLNVC
jgi:hypothetical protein